MSKTNPARGMRDFLPSDVRKREYVIGIIKQVYESYGFEPLETPAVENLDTLMGKYGEEGNQLIFKILKRGEKLTESRGSLGSLESLGSLGSLESLGSEDSSLTDQTSMTAKTELADLALRYDLTVPLARVVANNKNNLPKFFKRYQIQPVWRADRPARGRFREFYQCDVDAIGSNSVTVEAEQISAVSEILTRLGFNDFVIKLNHRELLSDILETAGVAKEQHIDALVAIDKLDKIGTAGVLEELTGRNISVDSANILLGIFAETQQIINEDREVNRTIMGNLLNIAGSEVLTNIGHIVKYAEGCPVQIDPSLARGLSYYTGAIFEIVLTEGDFKGSIGGGGRYDGLIGMFGKEQIPACGFSLGLERILVVMEERGMFPPEIAESRAADVMVTVWNDDTLGDSLRLAKILRQSGISVIVYPEADKFGKQMKYADQIKVPWVFVLGESEIADGTVTMKNMTSGEQETLSIEGAAKKLKP